MWFIDIFCTIIDFSKTYHGALTAFATIVIAFFTGTLWCVSRGQLRLQRAYVFGGCGPTYLWGTNGTPPPTGPNPEIWVLPDYHNDGLTPAYVELLLLATCREAELPRRASYRHARRIIISDPTPPDKVKYRPQIEPLHIDMREDNLMFYGRYFYRDMIGRRRYSSFIYRLRTNGNAERVLDVHRSYMKWT